MDEDGADPEEGVPTDGLVVVGRIAEDVEDVCIVVQVEREEGCGDVFHLDAQVVSATHDLDLIVVVITFYDESTALRFGGRRQAGTFSWRTAGLLGGSLKSGIKAGDLFCAESSEVIVGRGLWAM
jgi:hypothetical protein